MKSHFFTVIDEDGRTAGVIAPTTDREFESLLMDCVTNHFCVDDVSLPNSLQMEWFKNHSKPQTITISCNIDDDPIIYYDVKLEHTVLYEKDPKIFEDIACSEIKTTHNKVREILQKYGSEEYGDCIVDELCFTIGNYPTTTDIEQEPKS